MAIRKEAYAHAPRDETVMTDRETALRILDRVERDEAFASFLIPADAPFVRTLVFAVLRWRSQLDFLIEQLAHRPLAKIDERTLHVLRAGLAQLMHMEVPPYAALSETVDLAPKRSKTFVNAVLRSATRSDLRSMVPRDLSAASVAIREGHPTWMIERWSALFGIERAEAIAHANQEMSYPDLLVNTTKTTVDGVRRILDAKAIAHAPSELVENMIRLRASTASLRAEIGAGLVHPMDEGSAMIAHLIGGSGRSVIDLAAAPGGKSLVLALRGHRVITHDISLLRLGYVAKLERFIKLRIVVGDGRMPPFRSQAAESVLLDAPCSATGTLRKNPEVKWRLGRDGFAKFASLQRELLDAALTLARDECIYSTCSLEREENDEVVGTVLESHPEFERFDLGSVAPPPVARWIENGVLRLTPEAGTDGFTAFGLRRRVAF